MSANSLDAWIEIENSSLPPYEKIEACQSLLKQHKAEDYLHGELRGYIQLSSSYLVLEDLEQANKYILLARKMNKRVNSRIENVRINNIETSLFAMGGKLKEANEMILISLAESEELEDDVLIGDTLMEYAYIMQMGSQYADAIKALFRAQLIFEKLKDKHRVMSAQSYLAIIYARLKNFPKAIEYYEYSINYAKELEDDFDLSIFYYNLGAAHIGNENWEESHKNFMLARDLSLRLDDKAGVAFATAQLGNVLVKQHLYEQALPLLLEAYDTSEEFISRFMRLNMQLNIAMSYAKLGKDNLALPYIDDINLGSVGEDKRFPFLLMGEVHAELGNYQQASDIFLSHILRLNIESENNKKTSLHSLEVLYDVRFEKSRNELLRHENLLKQAELTEQSQYRLILLLTLVLVLVFLGGTFRHIRIQKKHKQTFKDLAFKDELTEIANRRGILDFASSAYQQSKTDNTPLILAIIDLDHFKQVNDTYGHDVGDQVLRYFAKNATDCLCNNERVGRYGGEEWLLVLPNLHPSEIEDKFKLLFKSYQGNKPNSLPKKLTLGFSMGVVIVEPSVDSSVKELLKQADIALYRAKVGGRSRFEVVEQD